MRPFLVAALLLCGAPAYAQLGPGAIPPASLLGQAGTWTALQSFNANANIKDTLEIDNATAARNFQMLHINAGVTTYPVVGLTPTQTDSYIALDLTPNGTPVDAGGDMAWMDIGNAGFGHNPIWLHLGMTSSAGRIFTTPYTSSGGAKILQLGVSDGTTLNVGLQIATNGNVSIPSAHQMFVTGTFNSTIGNSIGYNGLSGSATQYHGISLGRQVGETLLATIGSANQFISGSASADTVLTTKGLGNILLSAMSSTNGPAVKVTTANDVIMPNLPVACAGKVTGTLWNNAGVMNVCP